MIHFITDIRPGEPNILHGVAHLPLKIKSLDNNFVTSVSAPAGGWTHEKLECVACDLIEETKDGAEARLGDCWVGSTEV